MPPSFMETSGRGGGGRSSSGGRGRVSGRGRGHVDSGRGTAAAAAVGGVEPSRDDVTVDDSTTLVDGTTTETATTTTTTTHSTPTAAATTDPPAATPVAAAAATETPTSQAPLVPTTSGKEEEKGVVVTTTPKLPVVPVTVEGLQKTLALERKQSFDMHTHLSGQIHALRMELGARDRTIYYLERRLADVSFPPYSHWMNQNTATPEPKTPHKSTPKTTTPGNGKGPGKRPAASMSMYQSHTNMHSNVPPAKRTELTFRETQWNKRFAELVAFKATHGHCNPPAGGELAALSTWVYSQRVKLKQMMEEGKETGLHLDQIRRLREIGLTVKKEKEKEPELTFRETQWNKRFEEVVAFKATHGHCNPPAGGEHAALSTWVYSQRVKHKQMMEEGKETGLHLDQIRRLREIGFTFQKPKTGQLPFDQRMQQLLAFKAKTGHCNVPQNATDCPQGLPNFVQEQRKYFNFFKRGKKCSLTQERIDRLNALGFQWSLRGSQATSPRPPKKKGPKNTNSQDGDESEDMSHEESEMEDEEEEEE